MDYNKLLDLATDLGYRLAMSGAETFRVEESICRILACYGIQSEVFAIPNCLIVSIETPDGRPMTRMRRIGYHGNDLDAVEKYSNLSRRICGQHPEPRTALEWLQQTDNSKTTYGLPLYLLGNFLGACGFAILFGGTVVDSIWAGICGLIVGIFNKFMDSLNTNQFFRTLAAAFILAVPAYAIGTFGIADNTDAVIIGTLMILVPGLIFTNAMRDIIFGDTNSGINRIVQVFLIAAAIALGTAAAWNVSVCLWGVPENSMNADYSFLIVAMGALIGCIGFAILFNIHGPGGILCALGGLLTWCAYCVILRLGFNDIAAYFWATVVASIYSETMARIRKYPAISYLVVSVFPLIPGAGVYYTMNYAVRGDMAGFSSEGIHTVAVAGMMAVGILLVSTTFRLYGIWRIKKLKMKA